MMVVMMISRCHTHLYFSERTIKEHHPAGSFATYLAKINTAGVPWQADPTKRKLA
jgi:hypothetical protein